MCSYSYCNINLMQDEEAAIEKDTDNEKTDDSFKAKENRFQFLQKFTKFLQQPENENGELQVIENNLKIKLII